MVRGHLLRLANVVLLHETLQELPGRRVVFSVKSIIFMTSSVEAQKEFPNGRTIKDPSSLKGHSPVVGLWKFMVLSRIVCARNPVIIGCDVGQDLRPAFVSVTNRPPLRGLGIVCRRGPGPWARRFRKKLSRSLNCALRNHIPSCRTQCR